MPAHGPGRRRYSTVMIREAHVRKSDVGVRYSAVRRSWARQTVAVGRGSRLASVAEAVAVAVPSEPAAAVAAVSPAEEECSVRTCIFCDRPSGSVEYLWPEWLSRLFTGRAGVGNAEWGSVDCVCAICSEGWMRYLDDDVRPFLTSMIVGDATPLSPGRQKLLSRWAAKTAVVMEYACESSTRTPTFAREHLRRFGVHAGTQVLVGKYDGDLRVLTHERDLFSTTIDNEQHYLSQWTFVIGKVILQVFADPWRDTAPSSRTRRRTL